MDVVKTVGDTAQISVCVLLQPSSPLLGSIQANLDPSRYTVSLTEASEQLMGFCTHPVDCLIIEDPKKFVDLFAELTEAGVLLPTVLLIPAIESTGKAEMLQEYDRSSHFFYHPAEIKLDDSNLNGELPHAISQAVANFIRLSAIAQVDKRESIQTWFSQPSLQDKLQQQQVRLSQKLKERLGYLGVYYKRDPQQFVRNLDVDARQELLNTLKQEYRQIILSYFRDDQDINATLDAFVTKAFFADISVTWILEMHMNLMDDFAKKLKLEGRNDDVLLDYRLTLIDVIAHLAEMYRLSIPRKA